jgi:hypothetical protein
MGVETLLGRSMRGRFVKALKRSVIQVPGMPKYPMVSAVSLHILLFHIMFAVNAENYDPYGIWTSLKMVLTPLNVNRYRLLKN